MNDDPLARRNIRVGGAEGVWPAERERGLSLRFCFSLALLLLIAGLVACHGFFFFRDNFSTHYPMKVVSAAAFRSGAIPWWNPADAGGQPLAGNPNSLSFYPDNVLYILLPTHVAFNLHFLLHLGIGWLAMFTLVKCVMQRHSWREEAPDSSRWRGLSAAAFAAWLYALSGVALTACAFYNLIVAVGFIPVALLAIEKRSTAMLGAAFGLLLLAGEPVTLLGAAIACVIVAIGRMTPVKIVLAALLAALIASPQLIAYLEISREVERARGFSAATILNASLEPSRLLEVLIGPFMHGDENRLFLSLFVGVIALPAIFRRSRYVAVAAAMLFFALGRFNPLVAWLLPALRVARFPEKFALPMVAALCVLCGLYFARTAHRKLWMAITFVPLLAWGFVTVPLDWFGLYGGRTRFDAFREESWKAGGPRVKIDPMRGGQTLDRAGYRLRAAKHEPLFGALFGERYMLNRSGDGMHSLLSRIAAERFATTRNAAYLAIAGGPAVSMVPTAHGVASVQEAVAAIEHGVRGIAPRSWNGFSSPPDARISSYGEDADSVHFTIVTSAPALVFVNQTYFNAWVARSGNERLPTLPLDLDRLGVRVPRGRHDIVLRFGRHRTAVAAMWVLSWIALITACVKCVLAGMVPAMRGRQIQPGSG